MLPGAKLLLSVVYPPFVKETLSSPQLHTRSEPFHFRFFKKKDGQSQTMYQNSFWFIIVFLPRYLSSNSPDCIVRAICCCRPDLDYWWARGTLCCAFRDSRVLLSQHPAILLRCQQTVLIPIVTLVSLVLHYSKHTRQNEKKPRISNCWNLIFHHLLSIP